MPTLPPQPVAQVQPPAASAPLPSVRLPRRHHRVRWTVLSVVALAIIILGTGGWLAYRAISVVNTKKTDGSKVSLLQQLTHLVTTGNDQLQGEADGRVNILLLGYGGPGHDGPYLTDTMMVASFKPSTKQLALISIPRDLVVNIPRYGYRKINAALTYGKNDSYPGGGEAFTVKVVSDLLNMPIQYYARIDFQGFSNVIDQLGGVTVTVDNAFTDYSFPDNAYGYQTVSFKTGPQTMNGKTALNFARSRHGNNGEGSDFARAARQQKIIEAMKQKMMSLGTLSNPKKISDILGTLGSHSQTNMEVWEMLRFAKLAGDLQSNNISNVVFDDSTNGFLRAATGLDGAFILVPRDGNYHDMQYLAANVFLASAAAAEHANVMVVNATTLTGLNTTTPRGLSELGLNVLKTTSLSKTTIGQTVIVARQPGAFPNTEKLINGYVHAVGTLSLTNWQQQTNDTTLTDAFSLPVTLPTNGNVTSHTNTNTATTALPDLIVVLGQDQPKPSSGLLIPTTGTSTTSTNTNATTTTNTTSTNTNTKVTNTNTSKTNTTNTNSKTTNTNASTVNTNTKSVNTNTKVTNTTNTAKTTNSTISVQ